MNKETVIGEQKEFGDEAPLADVNAGDPTPQIAPTLDSLLREMEQRAHAVDPAPWIFGATDIQPDRFWVREEGRFGIGQHICFVHYGNEEKNKARATFIAAARSDVPALVKALRRAVEIAKSLTRSSSETVEIACERAARIETTIAKLLSEPADSVGAEGDKQ